MGVFLREFADEGSPLQIGRYALCGEIASGGMASIHYGRLIGPGRFSRAVAVKRLHRRHAEDDEFVSMFLDEARVAARVRHPNVVATLDVVSSSGELLIVMEYIEGETLGRLIAAGGGSRVPFRVAASVVGQLLRGLHAAHEARGEGGQALNLVHRDISPQNILVGTDGVVRVLDFGVAKAATHVQTTQRGKIKGKLGYMSPEQLHGEDCDRRADIFAAGIVLWESLTGRRLFRGSDIAEVVHKVTEAEVPPPSAVAPAIPVELETVVMRALERDPRDRYESARAFADALDGAMKPATVAEVVQWVTTAGRERLEARSVLIASLEERADRATEACADRATVPSANRATEPSGARASREQRLTPTSDFPAESDGRARLVLPPPHVPRFPRAPLMPRGTGMVERPGLSRSLRAVIAVALAAALVSAGVLAGLRLARPPGAAPHDGGFAAPAVTP